MAEVWLVESGLDDDYRVEGVFSTAAAANEYMQRRSGMFGAEETQRARGVEVDAGLAFDWRKIWITWLWIEEGDVIDRAERRQAGHRFVPEGWRHVLRGWELPIPSESVKVLSAVSQEDADRIAEEEAARRRAVPKVSLEAWFSPNGDLSVREKRIDDIVREEDVKRVLERWAKAGDYWVVKRDGAPVRDGIVGA